MAILLPLTTALSAFLLFWIQFLMARLLLPRFGGAPALWLTSLFYFQALLCLAYAYAHLLRQHLSLRKQLTVHCVWLILATSLLPISATRLPALESLDPTYQALLYLSMGCAGPFFVLGATSSLVQHWYRSIAPGEDPYWLYAASNLGSVLALLSGPLLVDRTLTLSVQCAVWTALFLVVILCLLIIASCTWKAANKVEAETSKTVKLEPGTRARWFLLSLVTTTLLYGLTGQITMDLATLPLLWMGPLLLYLLSFALAFSGQSLRGFGGALSFIACLSIFALLLLALPNLPLVRSYLGAVLVFQAAASGLIFFLLHSELANDKPDPSRLTDFYLTIAFGGFVGGALCTVAAPLMFPTLLEYPLGLLMALLLLSRRLPWKSRSGRVLLMLFSIFAALLFFAWSTEVFLGNLIFAAFASGLLVLMSRSFMLILRMRLFVFFLLTLGISAFAPAPMSGIVKVERSFFGVHRVLHEKKRGSFALLHGTTVHGRQFRSPERRSQPLVYYHRGGPVGQLLSTCVEPRKVAVFGLGVGTLAAYSQAEQEWLFFEIDPLVVKLARDTRYFHYLRQASGSVNIILGDARLSLASRPKSELLDLMIMDTFNSGSIPVHLLTVEAFQLYLSRLAPNGLLVLHISNQHLDLELVIEAMAETFGLAALSRKDARLSAEDRARGCSRSHWVALARAGADLNFLKSDKAWMSLRKSPGLKPWTDDYSDILSIIKIGK
jgi:hypothetical protein